mmetsp:Transcript_16981/g.28768  ORF Transcript_16981/g.28768 Transcript_16981/m.28768 type:complete len:152 (+) Transcript_16981:1788-2243(+)
MSSPFGVCYPCGHPFHHHCWSEMIANGKATKCPMCNNDVERFVRVFMDVPCDSKGDEVDRLQTDESKCAELEQVVREMKEEMSILQQHLNRFHKQALSQLSQMDLELQGIALVPSDEVCKKDEDICKLQERLRQFHEEALSQLEGDRVSFW